MIRTFEKKKKAKQKKKKRRAIIQTEISKSK